MRKSRRTSDSSHARLFQLPDKGTLKRNGPGGPLEYYYKPLIGRLYRARIERSLSLLTPPYRSILEIGYGSRILLPTLCSIGSEVYGIDTESDPSAVSEALKTAGCTPVLMRGSIEEVDLPDDHFDLIVAISVFEHIRDLSPLIERLFRLLRAGGQMLIGMPRVDTAMSAAFTMIGFRGIEDHHVTDTDRFLKAASHRFRLIQFRTMPGVLPRALALYFSMLLQKPLPPETPAAGCRSGTENGYA